MQKTRRKYRPTGLNLPLTETHQAKLSYWDYKRNKLSPHTLTYGCMELAWWVCPQNPSHRWQQRICEFCKRQTDCMFCARKSLEPTRSLAGRYPKMAEEWHPKYNGHITPETILALSNRSVWWRCRKNKAHEWSSSIRNRTQKSEGCPYCSQTSVSKKMGLAKQAPNLLNYWDWDNNHHISPQKIAVDSSFVATFVCPATKDFVRPHSFKMRIDKAVALGQEKDNICPQCNKEQAKEYGSLAQEFPDIALQWHKTKNGKFKPEQFKAHSSMLVWWQCPTAKDHQWRISINARSASDTGCPFCAYHQASSTHSLARDYPELAAQWHPSKNGQLTPDTITPQCQRLIWWQCPKAPDHEWATYPSERVIKKFGCPYCAGLKICKSNCLSTVFPEIAKQWHKTLNGKLKPNEIYHGSPKKAWWQCPLFQDHVWQAYIYNRTRNNNGCPKCVAFRTPPEKSLQKLFPKVAKQWHQQRNAPVTPLMVNSTTHKKYWWQCENIEHHIYQSAVCSRTLSSSGCPYCTNHKITRENSLAGENPKLAKEWHKTLNGDFKPSQIAPGSNKKVWWQCPKGEDHVWQAPPSSRNRANKGCPFCANLRFSKTQSLQFLHPEIAKQWHRKYNDDLKPDQLRTTDPRSVWWQCKKNPGHEWQSKIMNRIQEKTACPICSKNSV